MRTLPLLPEASPAYVTAHAARFMLGMLARGFTTVRDAGGADHGLARAVEEGLLPGPRVLFGGKALSQTGGHGDDRGPGREVFDDHPCVPGLSTICDGVPEVRRAARAGLRRGADHLKILVRGVAAPRSDITIDMTYLGPLLSSA